MPVLLLICRGFSGLHPKAWAGLAAVWILIFAAQFSMRDATPVMAEKAAPPSPEVIVELRQQQRMLAELIGARDTSDADRSKSLVPRPRTERVEVLMDEMSLKSGRGLP